MNIRVTICQSTLYEKPQKSAFFRPKIFLFRKKPLIWGQKSNFPLQNLAIRSVEFPNPTVVSKAFFMPNSEEHFSVSTLDFESDSGSGRGLFWGWGIRW